jgi:hypothetical protein
MDGVEKKTTFHNFLKEIIQLMIRLSEEEKLFEIFENISINVLSHL